MLPQASRPVRVAQWPAAAPAGGRRVGPARAAVPAEGSRLGFNLFIVVNAILFVRPTEIVPDLIGLPFYEWSMLACTAASAGGILRQFTKESLLGRPISFCVILLMPAILLSHVVHMQSTSLYLARFALFDFFKTLLYFLLLMANVNTAARLRQYLSWLTVFVFILGALPLLQYYGVIDIPNLTAMNQKEYVGDTSGEGYITVRLQSTGIYRDPNDLCTILVVGIALGLYFFGGASIFAKPFWLAGLAVLVYDLVLTKSRGGLLSLMAAAFIFMQQRLGVWKSSALLVLVLPFLLVLGGRQARFDFGDKTDTAQTRMEIWKEAFQMVRQSPVFGIGFGEFFEKTAAVTHNSFIQAYTDLGMFGGTLFLGAFYLAVRGVRRFRHGGVPVRDPDMRRLQPYMMAALVSVIVGLMALTRTFTVPTYQMVGLAAIYSEQTARISGVAPERVDARLLRRLAVASVLAVVAFYVMIRVGT